MTRCVLRMPLVDGLDAFDGEDVAGGFAAEFVGAVRSTDGDGKRVHVGLVDEIRRPGRIGKQLSWVSAPSAPDPSSLPALMVSSDPSNRARLQPRRPTAWAMSTTRRVTLML